MRVRVAAWRLILFALGAVAISSIPETCGQACADTTVTGGDETVSFARDLAGVLDENCANCHGNGQPVRGRLNLTTFRGLTRGGENGTVIAAGNAPESLLIQKLKGTADGQRMPVGRPPLSDEVIAKFEAWMNDRARFDGGDVNQNIGEVAAIARAMMATHEQLRGERAELAAKNWRLVLPDTAPDRVETEHFLLLGNVGSARLAQYGSAADALIPRISKLFKAASREPLLKGGMTLYCFKGSYDYGEFGRMVEKRDLPPHAHGHFRYTTVDAYGVLHVSPSQEDSLEALLAEQIAGIYIASRGESPAWFQQGVARATAARIAPQEAQVVDWNQRLADALPRLQSADDFLTGKATAEDAEVLAYSYAKFLMNDARRFQKLVTGLGAGEEFGQAFADSYGARPEQVAIAWVAGEAKSGLRRGRRRPRK